MLRNIKIYITILATMLAATSCLNKEPGSAIPQKDAMQTYEDAEQSLIGIYALLKSSA